MSSCPYNVLDSKLVPLRATPSRSVMIVSWNYLRPVHIKGHPILKNTSSLRDFPFWFTRIYPCHCLGIKKYNWTNVVCSTKSLFIVSRSSICNTQNHVVSINFESKHKSMFISALCIGFLGCAFGKNPLSWKWYILLFWNPYENLVFLFSHIILFQVRLVHQQCQQH